MLERELAHVKVNSRLTEKRQSERSSQLFQSQISIEIEYNQSISLKPLFFLYFLITLLIDW